MGTRADFYVGRGESAKWIGSIAWDGYPDGIPDEVKGAKSEKAFLRAVGKFFNDRKDVTLPKDGWPWPWATSSTTDYAYAFDEGKVWASSFGHAWFESAHEQPDDDATYTYRLPWPPSVNCYIRRGNNRSYMTPQGKRFREEVVDGIESPPMLLGRLIVAIELTAPDSRKRDIDNHVKPVLDALQHGGVFKDDAQVDLLRVARCHVERPGCCDVTITEFVEDDE